MRLGVLVLAAVMGLGGYELGHWRGDVSATEALRARAFTGAVVSLYDDGKGGCVRPDDGADAPDVGDEGVCGPFAWASAAPPKVDDRVRVTVVRTRLTGGEDVRALLLASTR